MYTVYVIQNEQTGKIYIGQTADLAKRLLRHNGVLPNKKTAYTQVNKGTWQCVYSELFATRAEAMRRERALKSSRGRNFLREKILGQ